MLNSHFQLVRSERICFDKKLTLNQEGICAEVKKGHDSQKEQCKQIFREKYLNPCS